MFSTDVLGTDTFMSLPPRAQVLYVQLSLSADDEGFLSNPLAVVRASKCKRTDVDALEKKGYVIRFPSGVLVITDWYKNNVLRKDRCIPTVHKEEREQLGITTQNRYFLTTTCQPSDNQLSTSCQPSGDNLSPQYNLSKNNITKKKEAKKEAAAKPTANEKSPAKPVFESLPDSLERIGYTATENLKKKQIPKLEQAAQHTTAKPPDDDAETRQLKARFLQQLNPEAAAPVNTPADNTPEKPAADSTQTPQPSGAQTHDQTDPQQEPQPPPG